MCRKPLIQHDYITLNNSTVLVLKTVLLHTVAPVSQWPWLESLWEQAKLSWHEAITSWLRHERCEPSSLTSGLLSDTAADSHLLSQKDLMTSNKLSSRLPTVFLDLRSLSVTACDHPQKDRPGRSSSEGMSCCNESRSWAGSANPIMMIVLNP